MSSRHLFCGALVLVSLIAGQWRSTAQAQSESDPDFSTVNDPLDGQRKVLVVDDLVLANPQADISGASANLRIFEMNRNQVVAQSTETLVAAPCKFTTTEGQPPPQQTRLAWVFNLPNAVQVTLAPTAGTSTRECAGDGNLAFAVQDPQDADNDFSSSALTLSANWLQTAVADFNQDGYEDLLVINDEAAFAVSAADPETPSAGLTFWPQTATKALGAPMSAPAVGDLDGDGNLEVAWIGGGTTTGSVLSLYFATVCQGPVGDTCVNREPFDIILLPNKTVALDTSVQDGATYFSPYPAAAVTIGKFGSGATDLLVAYSRTGAFRVTIYQFNGNSSVLPPAAVSSFDRSVAAPDAVLAASGGLDWFSGVDQAVIAWSWRDAKNSGHFEVMAIDVDGTNLRLLGGCRDDSSQWCLSLDSSDFADNIDALSLTGLALGGYNQDVVDVDGTIPAEEFNLKAAVSFSSKLASTRSVLNLYSFPAAQNGDFSLNQRSRLSFDLVYGGKTNRGGSLLQSGNREGQSMQLGEPFVWRITERTQPEIILGKPPMHAAYITPATAGSGPQLLNLSTTINDFYAKYAFTESNENKVSKEETTSFTWAIQQGGGATVKYTFPKAITVTGKADFAWTETNNRTVKEKYDTYTKVTASFSNQTGAGDVVRYSQYNQNYYLYPVLGQTTCPNDFVPDSEATQLLCQENAGGGCTCLEDGASEAICAGLPLDPAETACNQDDEGECCTIPQGPLYAVVSGPDDILDSVIANGQNTEWYQPVHEPFQVLSYPWDESQLQARYVQNLSILGSSSLVFTDNTATSFAFSWTGAGTESLTSGTSQTTDWDVSWSVTAGTNDLSKAAAGVEVRYNGAYNQSDMASTVNTNTTTLSASEGVSLALPQSFRSTSQYKYPLQAVIFGQSVADVVQDLDPETEVQTQGAIQVAWMADPTTSAGTWWDKGPYRELPDVALNRPEWLELVPANLSSGSQAPTNCLSINAKDTNKLNCVLIWGPQSATSLWGSSGFHMRGLFTTIGGPSGPQRTQANDGDEVWLAARVYNYSLVAMDAASLEQPAARIKVRFYGQEWNPSTLEPEADSFLIDEVELTPLPGFGESTNSSNWTTASTQWNTTGSANKSFLFWVVVWMEDAAGDLVKEIDGLGLAAKPATEFTDITCDFTTDPECVAPELQMVEVDECLMAGNSGASCDGNLITTSVSNNVAFLKSLFYVFPEEATLSNTPKPETVRPLEIKNLRVTPERARVGDVVEVSAEVHAPEHEANGLMVAFYDREPGPEEAAFDIEMLRVPADDWALVKVNYRPQACGAQELVVVADAGRKREARVRVSLDVACEPLPVQRQRNAIKIKRPSTRCHRWRHKGLGRGAHRGGCRDTGHDRP